MVVAAGRHVGVIARMRCHPIGRDAAFKNEALLRLFALLTLAELLELRFARLGNLAIYLMTLGLRVSAHIHHECGHEAKCCHFHEIPLRRPVIESSHADISRGQCVRFLPSSSGS